MYVDKLVARNNLHWAPSRAVKVLMRMEISHTATSATKASSNVPVCTDFMN